MLEYLEIYARLTGRILGISYWTACVTYFTWECVVMADYYVRYFLDQVHRTGASNQDNSLLFAVHSSSQPLASEKIVLMCGIFLTEKNLLKQPTYPSCQKIICWRENLNQAVCAGAAWLKTM